jgi:hypothetical protein
MNPEIPAIDYHAVLADLEARRSRLDAAIAGIKAVIIGQDLGGQLALPTSDIQSGFLSQNIQSDSFFGMTIVGATKKLLAMRRRTMTTPEIVQALRLGGISNAKSENFANSVAAGLSREDANDGDVVRVQRGTWGLAEWYPNKPRRTTATREPGEDGEEKAPS